MAERGARLPRLVLLALAVLPLEATAEPVAEAVGQAVSTAIAAGRAIEVSPDGDPLGAIEAAIATARGDPAIDTILLGRGTYFLPRAVRLEPADAGLTIAPAPGASPVLHGGLDLTAAQWTAAGDGIFTTVVDPTGLPRGVLDLHVGGVRQTQARHPNATPGDPTTGWLFAAPGTGGHESLAVDRHDIPDWLGPDWEEGDGPRLWVTDHAQWSSNTVAIAGVDREAGILELADNVPWHQVGEGSRYFFFASRAALDMPGEWHFDRATGTLAFMPPDPAALTDGTPIVAATTDSLIEIAGADDVTIHGLTLRDGSPHGGDRNYDHLQIGGGAIRVTDAKGVTLTGNIVANVGAGITLLDVDAATIAGNTIRHTAGNGIFLGMGWEGSGSRDVRIEGNDIRDVGHTFVESAGVMFQGTARSRIAGNRIERVAQFGVHGLQNRGADVDPLVDNVIEGNVIRDVNRLTADGGGIKLYAGMRGGAIGNVIRGNWIDGATHLMSRPDGSFFAADDWAADRWPQPISAALYLDWNIERTLIAGNLVTGSYGGVLLVNSDDNLVEHNIVLGGWGAALEIADQPAPDRLPMTGNILRGNVVVRDTDNSAAVRIYDPTGGPPPARFAGNVYFGPAVGPAAFLVQGRGWPRDLVGDIAAWRQLDDAAEDERLADPGFRDPANLDLGLRAESPLPALGIEAPSEALLALIGRVAGGPGGAGAAVRQRHRRRRLGIMVAKGCVAAGKR